jgi:PadR family transcriptional regulator, regulatory protein AphA
MLLIGVSIYSYQEQMSSRSLTTTSYAILGLLSINSWSTYELAQLMTRSLHFIWPRAESNIYAEPKRLVDAGMATAEVVWNGDRKRTVYSITPEGRAAFREWLGNVPAPQRLESEAAVHILYGNLGSKDDLLAAIARISTDADEWVTELCDLGDQYARGVGRFPERIHVNALLLTLMIEQARAAARWAEWATAEVEQWADTTTPDVEWAADTLRRLIDGEPVSDGS